MSTSPVFFFLSTVMILKGTSCFLKIIFWSLTKSHFLMHVPVRSRVCDITPENQEKVNPQNKKDWYKYWMLTFVYFLLQLRKLSSYDLCEIARNSVYQPSFYHECKVYLKGYYCLICWIYEWCYCYGPPNISFILFVWIFWIYMFVEWMLSDFRLIDSFLVIKLMHISNNFGL